MEPFAWAPPALRAVYAPQLRFSGTSIMGVSAATGKFASHVDTWDAIERQAFLSPEGVAELLAQLGRLDSLPLGVAGPGHALLRRYGKGVEVRRYDAFKVDDVLQLPPGHLASASGGPDHAYGPEWRILFLPGGRTCTATPLSGGGKLALAAGDEVPGGCYAVAPLGQRTDGASVSTAAARLLEALQAHAARGPAGETLQGLLKESPEPVLVVAYCGAELPPLSPKRTELWLRLPPAAAALILEPVENESTRVGG